MRFFVLYAVCLGVLFTACSKSEEEKPEPVVPKQLKVNRLLLDGEEWNSVRYNLGRNPVIRIVFSEPVLPSSVTNAVNLTNKAGQPIAANVVLEQKDSVLKIQPTGNLDFLTFHRLQLATTLKSASGGNFISSVDQQFVTKLDSSSKFPVLSDDALLTKVQEQTFRYFWDFGHPVSGMARERNNSGDLVTSGGTGFGIMALLVGVERGFITRQQGQERIQTITEFLRTKATRYHGAFAHWMNGATGATIPFSQKDNGADLVETSFLIMGLLTAREYFDDNAPAAIELRSRITEIYEAVEWDWFLRNNGDVLFWHWSPDFGWDMNLPIRGWNECLVTYVLAAGSPTHPITKEVYDKGWAREGAMKNGASYYGINLPLGEPYGGPLFLSHYSFLGINPIGLKDAYADYELQNRQHARINYQHNVQNPNRFFGYSSSVWGLTASDIPNGYTASSPQNDRGVIAPTAALASFPYTPDESMAALKFYYYVLGDKLFKEYGFIDAFSLHNTWFADSFLAIDQAPIIVMIENHRTGLCWDLFSDVPEVKAALRKLGFTAPYL